MACDVGVGEGGGERGRSAIKEYLLQASRVNAKKRHYMKMKRRFPFFAIYSQYGTVMRACEKGNFSN